MDDICRVCEGDASKASNLRCTSFKLLIVWTLMTRYYVASNLVELSAMFN